MTHIEEIESIIADYHAGTVPQGRMVEWVMQLVPDLLAENKRLREALSEISRQKLSSEMDTDAWTSADWTGGYDSCVETARAALTPEKVKP